MKKVLKGILFLCMTIILAGAQSVFATSTYERGCGVCHGEGAETSLHNTVHIDQGCTACHVDGPGTLPIPNYTCAECHPQDAPGLCPIVDIHSFSASCMDCHARDCATEAECELFIKYKKIRADKLHKPRKRALHIRGSEGFDPFGDRDLGPLTLRQVFFRKNKLKAVTTVPAGLAPQIIPIRVGECVGEIEIQ